MLWERREVLPRKSCDGVTHPSQDWVAAFLAEDLMGSRLRNHLLPLSAADFLLLDDFSDAHAARRSADRADLPSHRGSGAYRYVRRFDFAPHCLGDSDLSFPSVLSHDPGRACETEASETK